MLHSGLPNLALGKSRTLFLKYMAAAIFALSFSPYMVLGKVIYVDAAANAPVHDGTSWETAFADLKTGIVMAESGDQIWIAEGTYKPTMGTSKMATFLIIRNVEIYGGFAGTEDSISQRDIEAHPTILSGDLLGNDNKFENNKENSFHILYLFSSARVLLDGITVKGGNATDESYQNSIGGAILMQNQASLSMNNCSLAWNKAKKGGAIFLDNDARITIKNSTFTANSATSGAAICNVSQQPCLIQRSVFSGNEGFAIVNLPSATAKQHLSYCTITDNTGGSVHFSDKCFPTLEQTLICKNGGPEIQTGPQWEVLDCQIEGLEVTETNLASSPDLSQADTLIVKQEEKVGKKVSKKTPTVEPYNPFNMYVYPNPFKATLSLDFNKDLADKASLKLLDTQGKTILSREVEASQGKYQLAVTKDLPVGPYQVVLTYREQTYTQVVNKW